MTTIREKFGPKFEALFLDGRDRSNPLVGSQLQLGADGEYFNSNTRNLWRYYLAGVEDGTAAAIDDKPSPCADGHMPIGWIGTGGTWCETCGIKLDKEVMPAVAPVADQFPSLPEAPNKGHTCDGNGPLTADRNVTCSVCGFDWELPF